MSLCFSIMVFQQSSLVSHHDEVLSTQPQPPLSSGLGEADFDTDYRHPGPTARRIHRIHRAPPSSAPTGRKQGCLHCQWYPELLHHYVCLYTIKEDTSFGWAYLQNASGPEGGFGRQAHPHPSPCTAKSSFIQHRGHCGRATQHSSPV